MPLPEAVIDEAHGQRIALSYSGGKKHQTGALMLPLDQFARLGFDARFDPSAVSLGMLTLRDPDDGIVYGASYDDVAAWLLEYTPPHNPLMQETGGWSARAFRTVAAARDADNQCRYANCTAVLIPSQE